MNALKHIAQGALIAIAALVVVGSIINTVGDAADYVAQHVTICGGAR